MNDYRKKPVVIQAVQLRWDTWNEICEFVGVGKIADGRPEGVVRADGKIEMAIPTLEGVHTARENDWIIRGVRGELYPCKPDIFEMTYELDHPGAPPAQRQPRHEFAVREVLASEAAASRQWQIAAAFSELLDKLESVVPVGRERSLAVTKLQEAFFWSLRGIATSPSLAAPAPTRTNIP